MLTIPLKQNPPYSVEFEDCGAIEVIICEGTKVIYTMEVVGPRWLSWILFFFHFKMK